MFKVGARFLIVDDSATMREIVHSALSQLGYKNIDEATNGKLGLNKIQESVEAGEPYDLVFCDINMPELDGMKLLETLRSQRETATLPLLMMTTEGGKDVVLKAVMSGVSAYMVKPFNVDDVKAKLKEVYERLV